MRQLPNETIIELRTAGMSFRAIARRLNAPLSTVRCRAYKLVSRGILDTTATPLAHGYTAAETETIVELYRANVKYEVIAARLGRPGQGISRKISQLRAAGVIDGYRNRPPPKRIDYVNEDKRDDFSWAIYQSVVSNPGSSSADVGRLTGYGQWACERELLRLTRFVEPLVVRVRGRGWFVATEKGQAA